MAVTDESISKAAAGLLTQISEDALSYGLVWHVITTGYGNAAFQVNLASAARERGSGTDC
jgi:hypothetical protein